MVRVDLLTSYLDAMLRRARPFPRPPYAADRPGRNLGLNIGVPDSVHVVDLDDESFFDGTAGDYTVLDVWAGWCQPCLQFAPVFVAMAEEYVGRLRFARLNVDDCPRTAELLQIQSVPTMVLFDLEGNEMGRVPGAVYRDAFRKMLDDVCQRVGRA